MAIRAKVTIMATQPRPTTIRKLLAAPPEVIREIEKYRFRREHKTENAALLALVRLGLEADAKRPPPASRRTGSAA